MITNRSIPSFASGAQVAPIFSSLVLAGLLFPERIPAQDGPTTVDLGDCLEIEIEVDRRACIDARVAEFLDGRASGDAEIGTSAERGQSTAAARPPGQAAASNEPPRQDNDEQEYFGTIVSLEERLPSAYLITLDNGQIWEQTEPKRYPLRPGLEVRIYPTRWGSRYRLAGLGSGGHIQVRRLR